MDKLHKLYKCDPKKNTECTKENCGTHCTKATNENFAVQEEPTCTVCMDGECVTTNDFVAIVVKDNWDTMLVFNTDALTLGMGLRLLTKTFAEAMAASSEEEREEVRRILEDEHYNTIHTTKETVKLQRPTLSLITNDSTDGGHNE